MRKILPTVSLEPQSDYEWIFYGLTQDCQIFFVRPDQFEQLQHMRVQSKVTYCLPNLVQLHGRQFHHHGVDGSQMGLQLLFKRASNQICTLPIEFPSKNALSGFSIFSYSILSSLNYASCSYITNSSFIMEPDLSFMDTSYSDVIYFVDPDSRSSFWKIRQFKFDKEGYFKALETFIVKNFAEEKDRHNLCARDHLLVLDGQRHKLHSIQRHNKIVSSTCAYDLLFRPSKATIKKLNPLRHDSVQYRVNSFAADGTHLLIGESQRQIVSSLVIYRKRPKPKLICKEEQEWNMIAQAVGIGNDAESLLKNGTYFEITDSSSEESSSESKEQVKIVPRRLRRNIQNDGNSMMEFEEPIIVLNNYPTELNNFEIIGELTRREKKILRQKLLATCRALELD